MTGLLAGRTRIADDDRRPPPGSAVMDEMVDAITACGGECVVLVYPAPLEEETLWPDVSILITL